MQRGSRCRAQFSGLRPRVTDRQKRIPSARSGRLSDIFAFVTEFGTHIVAQSVANICYVGSSYNAERAHFWAIRN